MKGFFKKLSTLNINYIIYSIIKYLQRNKFYYKNNENSLLKDSLYFKKVRFILRNKSIFIKNFYIIKLLLLLNVKRFIFNNKKFIFIINKIILALRYFRLYHRRFSFIIMLINFFNLQFYISFSIDTLRGLYQLFFNYCEKKLINLYIRVLQATLIHKKKVYFFKLYLCYRNIRLKIFFIFFYIFCLFNIFFNKTLLINTPLDASMPVDRKEYRRPNLFTRFLPLPFLENVLFIVRPFYRYLNTFTQIKINISILNQLFYFYILYDFVYLFIYIYTYLFNKVLKLNVLIQEKNFFILKLLFFRLYYSIESLINISLNVSLLKFINVFFKKDKLLFIKLLFMVFYYLFLIIFSVIFFFLFLYFFDNFLIYLKFIIFLLFFYYFFIKLNLFFFHISHIENFFNYLYFDRKAYNMLHSLYIYYLFKLKKKLLFGDILYKYLINRLNIHLKSIDKKFMKTIYLTLTLNQLNHDDISKRYMQNNYCSTMVHSFFMCDVSSLIRFFFKGLIDKSELDLKYNLIYLAYVKRCKILNTSIKFKYIDFGTIIFLNNLNSFRNFNYITLLFFINYVISYDFSKNILFKLNPILKKRNVKVF